jgi:predicted RNase H-like HicB family nuclease
MEAHFTFTAVFEPAAEGGFVGSVAEIPGVNTQGETLEETRENLAEALELMLQVRREKAHAQRSMGTIEEPIRFAA